MLPGQAAQLAAALLDEHGLTARGWQFDYDGAVRRFGCCHYPSKTISLSLTLTQLNDEREVRDTILHEIAHALAGPQAKHGLSWRLEARRIGARPRRCYEAGEVKTPRAKFIGQCPSCQKEIKRFARKRIACVRCCNRENGGKFDARFLFTWRRNDQTSISHASTTCPVLDAAR